MNFRIFLILKAAIYTQYGGPEVLQVRDVEKPQPKDDEVLVKVRAVSINDWDWGLLIGEPWVNRTSKKPKYPILGSDIAGTVEAVGKSVARFKAGDEVFGDLSNMWGGFAEYVCAKEKMLAIKSPKMTFEEAAAIPQAGMLAVQGLIDAGKVKRGEKVLINGAAGGVGTLGIHLVNNIGGAEMTGVDSFHKLDILTQLGYQHTVDYTREDFTNTGKRYDLILDVKTNRPLHHYLRALNAGGRYITVGGSLGKIFAVFALGPVIGLFTGKKFRVVALKTNKDLEFMKELFDQGKLKVLIDGPYKLEQIRDVFEKYRNGQQRGKMVIAIN
ncbi:MAG TPA: NAD(P)-dependent alcohol dehydrogenase [Cyclobacteriaceae bacterium]|nr:NAD(P)-dependent alcohol dehydrogenase [Cyclobacteriaceae bacterium]